MVFGVCRQYIGVKRVALVHELIIREQMLHRMASPTLQLMLKIDGRPFWGNDQEFIEFNLLNYN